MLQELKREKIKTKACYFLPIADIPWPLRRSSSVISIIRIYSVLYIDTLDVYTGERKRERINTHNPHNMHFTFWLISFRSFQQWTAALQQLFSSCYSPLFFANYNVLPSSLSRSLTLSHSLSLSVSQSLSRRFRRTKDLFFIISNKHWESN